MIADGKHRATLFDITFGTTNSGAPLVSFVWELCDCGERVSYAFAMHTSSGGINYSAIQISRRWAPDWNGQDLSWFREHREELLGTSAVITTSNGKFIWVTAGEREQGTGNREQGTGVREQGTGVREQGTGIREQGTGNREQGTGVREQGTGVREQGTGNRERGVTKSYHLKLVVDLEKLKELPERIEPNFVEAKALFDAITEGTNKLDADLIWTVIAAKVGPMQVDFGEPEWTEMIERIRWLKSWEGEVEIV